MLEYNPGNILSVIRPQRLPKGRTIPNGVLVSALALTLFSGSIVATGCGSFRKSAVQSPRVPAEKLAPLAERVTDEGMQVTSLDLSGDGNPNLWQIREPGADWVARERWDLDGNGDPEVWRFFDVKGTMVREEMDLDGDGQVDLINYFRNNRLHRQEMSADFQGTLSGRRIVRNGSVDTVEYDTSGNGRIDTWELYENGMLIQIGKDSSGDGKLDSFIRPGGTLSGQAQMNFPIEERDPEAQQHPDGTSP